MTNLKRNFYVYLTVCKKVRLIGVQTTIYGQLQKILEVPIKPAPDEWDRLFNVDFFIKIGEKYIGLQIKPVNSGIQLPEIFKEYSIQSETHIKFSEVFGGKVFYLFSEKVGEKKEIKNKEVIEEIRDEIKRLSKKITTNANRSVYAIAAPWRDWFLCADPPDRHTKTS